MESSRAEKQTGLAAPWLVIVGPTAVGKSLVAEILAERFQTDIIISDSRQIYQGMEIGTGKPDKISRKRITRHLIDLIPPDQFFSAGAYQNAAERVIARMGEKRKKILIEGGTGLYLKAVLYRLWEGPPADWEYRAMLMAREKNEGEGTLHRDLKLLDPASGGKIHKRDLQKIVRALEVKHLTGRRLSDIHSEDASSKPCAGTPHMIVGLRRDRLDLYKRIETRVEKYIEDGLLEEVKQLMHLGLSPELPSMRGLGYRQMIPCVMGEQSLDEAVSILKRDTRRFAKRQMTWFTADKNIQWLDLDSDEEAVRSADRIMRLKKDRIML